MKLLAIFLLITLGCLAQEPAIKDTIYGQVSWYKDYIDVINPTKEIHTSLLFPDDDRLPFMGNQDRDLSLVSNAWYNNSYTQFIDYYREYDQNGRKIKERWRDAATDDQAVFLYQYDTLKHATEIKQLDETGTVISTERRYYNYKGKLISKLKDHNTFYSYWNYEYNANNECIKIVSFGEEGKNYEHSFEYENGKIKKSIRNGRIEESIYNEKGLLDKKLTYSSKPEDNGAAQHTYSYIYDEMGRETAVYSNGKIQFSRTYYKDGKVKKIQYSSEDNTNPYTIEYYYKGDLPIKVIHTDEKRKKKIIEFEYTFDDNNKWIKQVKIIDGKPEYTRNRLIVYYEKYDFQPEGN